MAIAWRSASDGMRPRFLAFARLDIKQASSATLILLAVSARHPARGFETYDTNDREQISSLFAWRSRAREEFEVKDKSVAFAASGGGHFVIVLEFEFLSRIIASMPSMSCCRHSGGLFGAQTQRAKTSAFRTATLPLRRSFTMIA